MSSDLPDMRPSSLAMTRMLVKTMSCDHAVQLRMREDFDRPPDIRTIRQVRIEEALGRLPRVDMDPCKPHDGYYPSDASDKLRANNAVFLERLRWAYPERFAA
jgi:hypothetical protein